MNRIFRTFTSSKKKKNFCSWRIERLVGWILFCFFLSPRCLSPIVSFLGLAPFPPSSDRAWDWDWNWDWDWDWDWDWGELFLFSGLPKGTKTSKLLKKKLGESVTSFENVTEVYCTGYAYNLIQLWHRTTSQIEPYVNSW